MKKVAVSTFVLVVLSFLTVSFGQGILTEDINPDLPPGVTLVIHNTAAQHEYGIAQELYVDPGFAEAVIAYGNSTTSFSLSVISRENVEIRIESTHPDLLVVGGGRMKIRAGARMTVPLTAFSAHSGEVVFYNTLGEVVERVPYSVVQDSGIRQNISAGINTDGNINASYSIRFEGGFGLSTSVGYSPDRSDFKGSISGSYSW